MCLGGALNAADLSGFICSDERVTLRDTTSGIYNLQVHRGFMWVCHYVMTMQWVVVYFYSNATIEINCSSLSYSWGSSVQWNFWSALSPGSEWMCFLRWKCKQNFKDREPEWFFYVWQFDCDMQVAWPKKSQNRDCTSYCCFNDLEGGSNGREIPSLESRGIFSLCFLFSSPIWKIINKSRTQRSVCLPFSTHFAWLLKIAQGWEAV